MGESDINLNKIIDYVNGEKKVFDRAAMLAGVTITAIMLGNTQFGTATSTSLSILGTSILPEIKKIIDLINKKDKETEAIEEYEKCRFTQILLARIAVKCSIERNLKGKNALFAKFKLSNLINEQQELKARDLDEERELKSIKAFINNTAYSNDEYWNELLEAILEVIDIETDEKQEFKDKMKREFVNAYESFKNKVVSKSEVFKIYINGSINKNQENMTKVISEIKKIISNNDYEINVEEDFKEYFVETKFYKDAVNGLEKNPIVFLLGMPGIGKTHTSRRICLEYKEEGYCIFYSDEGNIGNIMKCIQNCDNQKILVVLNDFLGQFYTNLNMSDTGEFGQLVSYIRTKKDIKLLVNSRNTIYNEALKHRKFNDAIDRNWRNICEIRADELSFEEKALILYNHLKKAYKRGDLSKEKCLAVIENRKYAEIIINEKFNPRIIEYVTTGRKAAMILPEEYIAFINQVLENPEIIWEEEFGNLDKIDRIFINTLFSLTKTYVSKDILKECFNNRIKYDVDIKDTTINYFDSSFHRLCESMTQVNKSEGKEKIGVMNPSINAYLYESLVNNENEVEEIIKHALYLDQLECFDSLKCAKNQIIELINSGQYCKLNTISKQLFNNMPMEFVPPNYMYTLKLLFFILDEYELSKICFEKIDIQNFILDIFKNNTSNIEVNSRLYFASEFSNIFCKLFTKPKIFDYDFTEIISNEVYLQIIINSVSLQDDFWEILNNIQKKYYLCSKDKFYASIGVKNATVGRIEMEATEQVHDEVIKIIKSLIKTNIDDFDDFDEFIYFIVDEVNPEIIDIISDTIIYKLALHNIDFISIDDFDLDDIINEQLDIYYLIESECSRILDNDGHEEYIENAQKTADAIFSIFEVCFF